MFRTSRPSARFGLRSAIGALVALALAAAASGCGGGSSGSVNPATTLAAALKLQQQGNLSEATQLYKQVIAAQPNNVYAHFDLGVIAQGSDDPTGALADYGAALTISPNFVPALFNEATIYTTTDPVLAVSLYRQIVVIQPHAPTAFLNLGFLEIKRGEAKRGVKDLATAVQQDSSLISRLPKNLQRLVTAVSTPAQTKSPKPSSTPTSSPTITPS